MRVLVILLVAVGALALAGVAFAQQAGWIASLTEEYSLVWKSAYEETAQFGLPPAGREAVAHRVLDAHIATRTAPGNGGVVPPVQPTQAAIDCGQAIASNGTISGQWTGGCDSAEPGRGFARYYSFTLAEDSSVTVTFESSDTDPYLYLRQGNARSGSALFENDDHDGSRSISQVQQQLAAGSYTIEATTFNTGQTGSFSLTVSSEVGVPDSTPGPITVSQINGYTSEYRIQVFVSSIGVNLSMSRWNRFTVNGAYVRLDSGGNLTTGGLGSALADRYFWSCNPVNGSSGEGRVYASNEYRSDLPRTDLDNSPLFNHSFGRDVLRMCEGDEPPSSSTTTRTWTERFTLP